MMTRIGMVLVLSAVVLAGCAATMVDGSRLLAGATVVLQQDLTIPSGHARVFLQGGAVVEKTRLNIYQPHCNFEQRVVSDGSAVIAADRFLVTQVSVGDDFIVQRGAALFASLGMDGGNGIPGNLHRYVRHTLSSPRQPQVMRLTCHGGAEIPGRAEWPRLHEIRAALGSVATIELP